MSENVTWIKSNTLPTPACQKAGRSLCFIMQTAKEWEQSTSNLNSKISHFPHGFYYNLKGLLHPSLTLRLSLHMSSFPSQYCAIQSSHLPGCSMNSDNTPWIQRQLWLTHLTTHSTVRLTLSWTTGTKLILWFFFQSQLSIVETEEKKNQNNQKTI